jgi:hypothetical protein
MPEVIFFLADLDKNGIAVNRRTQHKGYDFVEVLRADGRVARYRRDDPTKPPTEQDSVASLAQYGVSWEDISTDEDRRYWVAGGKLQIIDLRSNEVLAERIGYLFEAGFGSTSGGRRPWVYARLFYSEQACPAFRRHAHINRMFVEKVLAPRKRKDDYAK